MSLIYAQFRTNAALTLVRSVHFPSVLRFNTGTRIQLRASEVNQWMGKKQYYVVAKGRQTGIFRSWNECENQVKGFPNAVFKGFERYDDANAYLSQQSRPMHTTAPQQQQQSAYPPQQASHATPAPTSHMPPRTHHRTPQLPASNAPAAAASASSSSSLPFAPSNRLPASSSQLPRHSASPYDRPAPKINNHAHFSTSITSSSQVSPAAAAPSASSTPAAASASTAKYAIVYCDGAAKNNPKGPMGCGGIMYDSNSHGDQLSELSTFKQFLGYGSNNESEYHGLIIGMELALKNGVTHLVVKMDSELVAKQMTGDYQVKAANLKVLYMRALDFASRFQDIKIQHVLRHENSLADALANESIYQRER